MFRTLLAELRRRGVLKTGAAYLVVGFGVLQGADIALPRLGVGDGVLTALVVGVVAGFPLVVVLSWFYDLGAGGLVRTAAGDGAEVGPQGTVVGIVAGIAALAVLAGVGWSVLERRADGGVAEETPLADDRVAIPPFRIAGDPSLAYLGEGMLDLLAAKLTGEGGLRAVEPRAVLARWRGMEEGSEDDARSVARALGAGRLLMGSIVGSSASVQVAGRILDTRTGGLLGSYEVTGAPEEVAALVDRFAGGLLSQVADVDPDRLRALEGRPLPALRAYLEGHRLLRDGRFEEAKSQFGLAQAIDSTFALPGIFHWIAASFTSRWDWSGAERAFRHRDALAPRDQLLVEAVVGLDGRPWAEREAFLQRMVDDAPDRVEAWYLMADAIYHDDLSTPLPDRLARAGALFRAAVELDDRFGPAEMHLFEIALLQGDVDTARRLARSVAEHARDGDLTAYTTWFVDRLEGRAPPSPRDGDPFVVMTVWGAVNSAVFGVGLDASDAVVEWSVRAASEADRSMLEEAARYMWNRGRPERAASIVDARQLTAAFPPAATRILTALFWEAPIPEESLLAAAEALAGSAAEARVAGDPWIVPACVAGLYHAARGRPGEGPSLDPPPGAALTPDSPEDRYRSACRAAQGILAGLGRRDLFVGGDPAPAEAAPPELEVHLEELDRLLAEGRIPDAWLRDAAPLILAWGCERIGDLEGALDAVRRHRVALPGVNFTSSYLREEGRLAARLGRSGEALVALRRYVAVRAGAESDVAPAVEQMQALLAELERS